MVVTMPPDRVIKHFDVIEYITPCLLAIGIDSSVRIQGTDHGSPENQGDLQDAGIRIR